MVSTSSTWPAAGLTPNTIGVELCAYVTVHSTSVPQIAPASARSRVTSKPGVEELQKPDASLMPSIAGSRQSINVPSGSRKKIGHSHMPPIVMLR